MHNPQSVEYQIDPSRRRIKARLHTDQGVCAGWAHCLPTDTWNEDLGKRLALARAELKYITRATRYYTAEYKTKLLDSRRLVAEAMLAADRNNALMDRYFDLKTQIDSDIDL